VSAKEFLVLGCRLSGLWALPVIAVFLTSAAAVAATPSVRKVGAAIEYIDPKGATYRIGFPGKLAEPVLAPDGRTVAFLRYEKTPPGEEWTRTSLWVVDGPTGEARKLIEPRPDTDPQANLAVFEHPVFSLDGRFVYVSANAWVTSSAVHQVNVRTGAERFVSDGYASALIRTGPWRGYLLVGRHMYWPAPREGSYNPVYVVRPDGKEKFVVPGSETDDGGEAIEPWLKAHGWTAW
jgi:hypothetical protein